MILLPGISKSQCPTSYSGEVFNVQDFGGSCGFKTVTARININGSAFAFGRMDVKFSNNVKIYSATKIADYVTNIVIASNGTEVGFILGNICESKNIVDEDNLVLIVFNVMSGSSASAKTDETRLYHVDPCATLCNGYSEENSININVDPYELNGNILIPPLFSCSGGSSIDHGLPDREVTVSMADSPNWDLCTDVSTNSYGYYECEELREDCDYKICVVGPEDDYCGIDEFDIDIIRDFILGIICPFDYKWQQFAADVDNNGQVTTGDVVHLENYLINGSYNIPVKWKYVSNTQFDQFSVDCNSQYRDLVPVVDNCSEINISADPEVEDWYGFPAGDLNGSCTTCGLKADLPILTRALANPLQLIVNSTSENIYQLYINHVHSVNVFSLTLEIGRDVEHLAEIKLISGNPAGLVYNIVKEQGVINLVYAHLDRSELTTLRFEFRFKHSTKHLASTWKINSNAGKINNVLIDELKTAYPIEIIHNDYHNQPYVFPNPASHVLVLQNLLGSQDFVIRDIMGRIIKNGINVDHKIDISHLKPGCYYLEVKSIENSFIFRFVKN